MTNRARVLLVAAILAPLAVAQSGRSLAMYKVDFTIRDSGDAGAKTGRKFSLLMVEHQKTVFRVGSRVPTATSSNSMNTQFTYVDVGVNMDCTIGEMEGKLGMHVDLDISGAVNSDKNAGSNPTISQIKLTIDTNLTPGKSAVVAAFDDPVTSRKFDVEALATRQ